MKRPLYDSTDRWFIVRNDSLFAALARFQFAVRKFRRLLIKNYIK